MGEKQQALSGPPSTIRPGGEGAGFSFPEMHRGWFMTKVQGVLVLYMDARMDAASFKRYLVVLAAEIDSRQKPTPVLYEAPLVWSLNPVHRLEMAKVIRARAEKTNWSTAAFALVTTSLAVRGVFTAMQWLISPKYPLSAKPDVPSAAAYLKTHCPEVDPAQFVADYASLKQRLVPRLG